MVTHRFCTLSKWGDMSMTDQPLEVMRAFHPILSSAICFFDLMHAHFIDSWWLISNLGLILDIQLQLGGMFEPFGSAESRLICMFVNFCCKGSIVGSIGWLCVCACVIFWRLCLYHVAFLSRDLQVSPCAAHCCLYYNRLDYAIVLYNAVRYPVSMLAVSIKWHVVFSCLLYYVRTCMSVCIRI